MVAFVGSFDLSVGQEITQKMHYPDSLPLWAFKMSGR
jgi:hypothetical protein